MIGLDRTEINFPQSSTHSNSPICQQTQELSFLMSLTLTRFSFWLLKREVHINYLLTQTDYIIIIILFLAFVTFHSSANPKER